MDLASEVCVTPFRILIRFFPRAMPKAYLKRVIQSVHWHRVHRADNLQNTIEIIQILKNLQDFYDPTQHSHSLFKVLGFHYAPNQKMEFEKHR